MRLIDADALRATFTGDDWSCAHIRDEIDAAPTVCCATCKHKGAVVVRTGLGDDCPCGLNARWNALTYGCSRYKRREP